MSTHQSVPQRHGPRRQRGVVMIVFGLSIAILIGFLALVVDLGRTYVVRTELQNAADAAALAGARELNQTFAGVTSAVNFAIAMAAQNKYIFTTPVTITIANISVGSTPADDSNMVLASTVTTDAGAAGKTFLKVNIPSGNLVAFFSTLMGTASTSTFGLSVAGRFINDVTPIGVCAIKDVSGVSRPKGEALPGTNELSQLGFRRGMSYNIFNLGPLGGSSTPYLIDPVDVYPNACNPGNASANVTAPFVCNGSSAVLTTTPGFVYGNTGVSAQKIEKALNSRFNDYSGASVCLPANSPPDVNVQRYGCTGGGCATPSANWMTPSNQSLSNSVGIPASAGATPAGIASKNDYGVLWSYSRGVNADAGSPYPVAGANFATTDWTTLYPAPGGAPAAAASPAFPAATSPYLDPAHITAPLTNTGVANRRVLNLAIVDCPNVVSSSASCNSMNTLPVLGIGRFFMQVPADFTGGNTLNVEFAGLIEPTPVSDIKLYR